MRYGVTALLVAFGALLVVAGEKDDSPGLGGIGLLIALGAVVWLIRSKRRGTSA